MSVDQLKSMHTAIQYRKCNWMEVVDRINLNVNYSRASSSLLQSREVIIKSFAIIIHIHYNPSERERGNVEQNSPEDGSEPSSLALLVAKTYFQTFVDAAAASCTVTKL